MLTKNISICEYLQMYRTLSYLLIKFIVVLEVLCNTFKGLKQFEETL